MNDDSEPFSNPVAPAHVKTKTSSSASSQDRQRLTNDDFRKLMMTPRAGSVSSTPFQGQSHSSQKQGQRKRIFQQKPSENVTKKKKFFQTMKKQEDDTLAELAARYRDRARERRDGPNAERPEDPSTSVPSYRAVSHDSKSVINTAERRKQVIEESKFLGGDMEHTHLVKGLDYALLQKVKAEITENEILDDDIEDVDDLEQLPKSSNEKSDDDDDDNRWEVKSVLANNILNIIKYVPPERNDLFLPMRMTYIVDLENECADDIPTTIIRSRADCPNWSKSTLSTNDIVVNKLIQIMSGLRTKGSKEARKAVSDKDVSRSTQAIVKHQEPLDKKSLKHSSPTSSISNFNKYEYDDMFDFDD